MASHRGIITLVFQNKFSSSQNHSSSVWRSSWTKSYAKSGKKLGVNFYVLWYSLPSSSPRPCIRTWGVFLSVQILRPEFSLQLTVSVFRTEPAVTRERPAFTQRRAVDRHIVEEPGGATSSIIMSNPGNNDQEIQNVGKCHKRLHKIDIQYLRNP